MRGRTTRVLVAAAAGALIATTYATAAAGAQQQPTEPTITSPAPQSGVTQGEEVAVVGSGCMPDSEVTIEFNGAPVGTTRADGAGAFTGSFTVPVYEIPDVEEGSESSVAVVCDGRRAATVVAVNEAAGSSGEMPDEASTTTTPPGSAVTPEGGSGDLDALPRTGSGATAALAALGAVLVTGGTALVHKGRARRPHGAR